MMENEPTIEITKLEAARRQLRVAIRLWFNDDDPIAIHTLVAAAHDILHTLFRRRGLKGLIFDSKIIKDEQRAESVRRIKAIANFFKHADRDPDAIFEFNPSVNELLLFFSAQALEKMGEPSGIEETAFLQWKFITRPDLLHKFADYSVPVDVINNLRSGGKCEFFKGYLAYRRNIDKITTV